MSLFEKVSQRKIGRISRNPQLCVKLRTNIQFQAYTNTYCDIEKEYLLNSISFKLYTKNILVINIIFSNLTNRIALRFTPFASSYTHKIFFIGQLINFLQGIRRSINIKIKSMNREPAEPTTLENENT